MKGSAGAQGHFGPQGQSGFTGVAPHGLQGVPGAQGPQGTQGAPGLANLSGTQGLQGFQGASFAADLLVYSAPGLAVSASFVQIVPGFGNSMPFASAPNSAVVAPGLPGYAMWFAAPRAGTLSVLTVDVSVSASAGVASVVQASGGIFTAPPPASGQLPVFAPSPLAFVLELPTSPAPQYASTSSRIGAVTVVSGGLVAFVVSSIGIPNSQSGATVTLRASVLFS